MRARRMLFLQGVASPFFASLADYLQSLGATIYRINFCGGDALYWGRRAAWNFRGGLQALPAYLESKFAQHGFTDILLFGDQRPIHRVAITIAKSHRASVHVFEEGYFRPNWFTLERNGVNASSALPRDPAWYRATEPFVDSPAPEHVPGDIRIRAVHDMAYHLANVLNPISYPGYRTHRPYNALREYLGWVRRFSKAPWYRRRDRRCIQALRASDTPFYLLPLQLNGDFQIARHSHYRDMTQVIEQVVESFAKHAPECSRLVIKNHPLDTGLVNYPRALRRLEVRHGLARRVLYLESGDLQELLKRTKGCVTVNSTVGLSALSQSVAVCTLGEAIYSLPGLTHQGGLDSFWQQPMRPDPTLVKAFQRVVIETTQINGDLYTRRGIASAITRLPSYLGAQSKLERCLALGG